MSDTGGVIDRGGDGRSLRFRLPAIAVDVFEVSAKTAAFANMCKPSVEEVDSCCSAETVFKPREE